MVKASGTASSRMKAAPASMAVAKLAAAGDQHERGDDHHAAEARAVEGEADGEPAPLLEPQAQDVVDGAEAHGGPAERHDEIGGDQLPGLGHERQGRRRARKRGRAEQHAGGDAEAAERVVDEDHQQRAEEVARPCWRRRSATPASRAGAELGQIEAVAVEAEAPGQQGEHEAGRDHPPAVVAGRGLVGGWRPSALSSSGRQPVDVRSCG